MRPLLTFALALCVSGCSFYSPVVTDCAIGCGEGGACPDGFSCRGAFCRPTSGPKEDCECRAGSTRACGTDEGECSAGSQACSATGTWGACEGAVGPTPERCDGKDNDCDGLVDLGPIKTLLTDNTGPFEGFWKLHGHDGGYTMVTPLALPDGGASFHALYFDEQLEPRGRSLPIAEGYWRRMDSVADGPTLYAAYYVDEDLHVSRIMQDGGVSLFGVVPDAGYLGSVQMGARAIGLVTTWLTVDATARVAKWSRLGGPPLLGELGPLPEGTLAYLTSTTDGQYVMLESDLPDGGYMDGVHSIDDAAPLSTSSPYWNTRKFITRRSGQVVHLDILDIENATKVVFYRDVKTQTGTGYMVVEEDGRWHDIDFVLDDRENLVAAYVNDATQQLVLARIEGTMASDQQVTRKVLEGVTVPVTDQAGNIRVAKVPGDPMFGLVWSTRLAVFGRRFCSP